MKTKDFYYDLPEELIAQDPIPDRSASRLLHLDRKTGKTKHEIFSDLPSHLREGDCLVINDTKVIPARLYGRRKETGGAVEVLLLKHLEDRSWECLVRPGKKCRPGSRLVFGEASPENGKAAAGSSAYLEAEVLDVVEDGNRIIRFDYEGIFEEILDRLGEMPLPPYIKHKLAEKDRYQTVYARVTGSAAAPTAGLHFTKELLEEIRAMGVHIAHVTLHVGLGTFRPVKAEEITDHHMHTEFYQIDRDQADLINSTRKSGGRIICVGTTSVRTLESAADGEGTIRAGSGDTSIFIYPGYRFKAVDALITNFHLPESTLIMLVSAFAGRENVLAAYREAVEMRYRFFSFGDAMLIE